MQSIHNTIFGTRILFLALLAGLLLVAPCKVRNSLEHALGLEKSEVSNKIKTTVSVESCASYEAVQPTADSSIVMDMATALWPALSIDLFVAASNIENNFFTAQQQKAASVVPLYILYRQFKIHS